MLLPLQRGVRTQFVRIARHALHRPKETKRNSYLARAYSPPPADSGASPEQSSRSSEPRRCSAPSTDCPRDRGARSRRRGRTAARGPPLRHVRRPRERDPLNSGFAPTSCLDQTTPCPAPHRLRPGRRHFRRCPVHAGIRLPDRGAPERRRALAGRGRDRLDGVARGEVVKKGQLLAILASGPERAAVDLARSAPRWKAKSSRPKRGKIWRRRNGSAR